MSTCKWEQSEQDLEHRIIKAASFHVHALLASLSTYFSNHQITELKSRLWILNLFQQQQPLGPLGHVLKNDFCQQAFFSRGKHAKFRMRALNRS